MSQAKLTLMPKVRKAKFGFKAGFYLSNVILLGKVMEFVNVNPTLCKAELSGYNSDQEFKIYTDDEEIAKQITNLFT